MRRAVAELSWLLERGYSDNSALKLVGDRHELRARQRRAVMRCACTDRAVRDRAARRLPSAALAGRDLVIDGFNCIITLEAALSGSVVLIGRDGGYRDLSSVHGSYRRVEETETAIAAVAALCDRHRPASVHWLLDRPVSNSGRLKALIETSAPSSGSWTVELSYNPDRELAGMSDRVAATSDSWILDHCGAWVDLPRAMIAHQIDTAWVVDLGRGP